MILAAAISVADYNIKTFPYVLASCYPFCDGIAIIHSSPFGIKKEVVEEIKYYIQQFPHHEKKIKFRTIPWYYSNTNTAKSRGYLTTTDKRFVGIAGPESQSMLDALKFHPHRIFYTAGDQVCYEHWINIKPWIKLHWHINTLLRYHLLNFLGPETIGSQVTDPYEYEKLIATNLDWDSQVGIVEPGMMCEHTEGAICFNEIPSQENQPVIRTNICAHFREWTPISDPLKIRYERALTRIRIRNINEEYNKILTEDEEIDIAKKNVGTTWEYGGLKCGSSGYDLLTPPRMPIWMYEKEPWKLLENIEDITKNAWVPNLSIKK